MLLTKLSISISIFYARLDLYQMIIYVHEEGSHPSQPSIYVRYIWNMTNQLSIVCTLV